MEMSRLCNLQLTPLCMPAFAAKKSASSLALKWVEILYLQAYLLPLVN